MTKRLPESIILLEHYQNEKQDRSGYLRGLALDCFEHQEKDRNSHYLAREMLWTGRPKSAIKEFKRHIAMKKWAAERAQSMIFIGDAYKMLNKRDKAFEWYNKALWVDADRREAFMRLSRLFYEQGDAQRTACYASAASEIPWNAYYANQRQHYTNEPHELLYWALWNIDRNKSKYHWEKALEYQPLNTKYLYDARFYIDLPKVSIVIPSMRDESKTIEAIHKTANYPDYEIIVEKDSFENNIGVAKTFNNGVAKSKGDLIVYMGDNDIPQPNFLILAVLKMIKEFPEMDGLVGLNDMHWHGEFATHFLISKKLLPYLDNEIFYHGYYHCGVDNELTERCRKIGKYVWCEEAKLKMKNLSSDGTINRDKVYNFSYNAEHLKHDKELLKKRSQELGFELRENFTRPNANNTNNTNK